MSKPKTKHVEPIGAPPPRPELADKPRAPTASPARQLQARLHAQFQPDIAPVWTRYVTLFLVFGLLGAWMFGLGGYTNLYL